MSLFNKDLHMFIDRRFFVNTYVLSNKNECVIIDLSMSDEKVDALLQNDNLKPVALILTHGHYDHIGNSFIYARKHGLKIYAHKEEKQIIEGGHLAKELGVSPVIYPELVEYFDGDTLRIGVFQFDVFLFKGHTPGGVCLKYQGYVFSGDNVFYDSIGRTDLIYGNSDDMNKSLVKFKKRFSGDLLVLPGHGYIGKLDEIYKTNPHLCKL